MHKRTNAGQVVFIWPLTAEVAKAFDLGTRRTGLMIAVKPDAAMLRKFRSGELQAFSVGGSRIMDEKVDD
jgi:hypothetical protein